MTATHSYVGSVRCCGRALWVIGEDDEDREWLAYRMREIVLLNGTIDRLPAEEALKKSIGMGLCKCASRPALRSVP